MSKKRTTTDRLWETCIQDSFNLGSTNVAFARMLIDLKSVLENLAGQGEEFKISKATLSVTSVPIQSGTVATVAMVVSDQVIQNATPNNTSYWMLDDLIDGMTSGDYELQRIGNSHEKWVDATHATFTSSHDITALVQKAARLLARSAILATNPEIAIVIAGINSVSAMNMSFNASLTIQGSLGQKPLRMLA